MIDEIGNVTGTAKDGILDEFDSIGEKVGATASSTIDGVSDSALGKGAESLADNVATTTDKVIGEQGLVNTTLGTITDGVTSVRDNVLGKDADPLLTQTRLDAETKLIDNLSTPDGLGEAEWALMNKESKLKYINENPDKYPNDDVSLLETYTNAVEAEQEASNPGIVDGLGNIIENGIDRLDNGLQTANEAIFGNEEEDKKGVLGHGEEFLFGDSEKADRLDKAQDDFFNFTPKTETEDVAVGRARSKLPMTHGVV